MSNDHLRCATCGLWEHIDLLDAKPSCGDFENGDYDRLECIACYGEHWIAIDRKHVHKSIAPSLAPFYAQYVDSTNWLIAKGY